MFLKNKNIIFKIRRSKVTDYAALTKVQYLQTAVNNSVGRDQLALHEPADVAPHCFQNQIYLNLAWKVFIN